MNLDARSMIVDDLKIKVEAGDVDLLRLEDIYDLLRCRKFGCNLFKPLQYWLLIRKNL